MFKQHANAVRSFAGSSIFLKCGNKSSMMHFTTPEASEAAEWQCTHPSVCTTLVIEFPVPPTGYPAASSFLISGSTLLSSTRRNSTLFRLVNLKCPSQNSSATSAKNRMVSMLASRVFPSTDYIQPPSELDYTPAPDLFHDIFGHTPMITHQRFADFYQNIGRASLNAKGEDRRRLERVSWVRQSYGLEERTVNSIARGNDGSLLVGTWGDGLYR